jgi:hypothetical protein
MIFVSRKLLVQGTSHSIFVFLEGVKIIIVIILLEARS